MKPIVIFVLPSFRRGGVERVTLNILNSLNTDLFEIHLLLCKGGDNHLLERLKKGVIVRELYKPDVRSSIKPIYNYLRKHKADIVFSSFGHLNFILLLIKRMFLPSLDVVIRFNSLPSNKLSSSIKGRFSERVNKYLIRFARFIISQSEEMRSDILTHYNVDDTKVITIRNLVDVDSVKLQSEEFIPDDIPQNQKDFVLIAIGSLSSIKGFDLLIESISTLKDNGISNVKLYIIGDNRDDRIDYQSFLKNLILEKDLNDQVFLLGYKRNPFPYLKYADAFVLSSRKEGFPNVVLEALSLSKVCLVTNCVDFTGVIENGVHGVVVEKNSSQALSEGIKEVMKMQVDNVVECSMEQFDYNSWFLSMIKSK